MSRGGYRPGAGRKRDGYVPTPEQLAAHQAQVAAWRAARQPDDELRAALSALDAARLRVAAAARHLIKKAPSLP